jgi:amino acid transporter
VTGQRLQRSLSLPYGVGLAVSTIIGSGLLGLPGLAIEEGGAPAAMAGWLATFALSIPLMLLFLRLTLRASDAGGLAAYAGLSFGPAAGRAVTFVLAATFSLCIPIGTVMGSAYLQRIFGLPEWSVLPLALAILGFSTLINIAGVKPSGMVNNVAVVALVALIVILVAANPAETARGAQLARDVATGQESVGIGALWAVSAILFRAYLGWENLSFGSEEFEGNAAQVRRIFLIGFLVVGLLYAGLAMVSTGAALSGLPVGGVTGLLGLVEGRAVAPFVHAIVVLVVVANVNAWVFAASRLFFAAGRAGDLPAYLGRLAARGTPAASLLTLLAVYAAFTVAITRDRLPLSTGLAIANQNFVALYLFAVVASWRLDPTLAGRLLAVLSLASAAFLLSGFGWWLLLPVALGLMGYLRHRLARPAPLPGPAAGQPAA